MIYLQLAAVGWLVSWPSAGWQVKPAWGQSNQSSVHWSFQQPELPDLPNIARPDWPHNPIDCFVLDRLERYRLAPSVSVVRSQGLNVRLTDVGGYVVQKLLKQRSAI